MNVAVAEVLRAGLSQLPLAPDPAREAQLLDFIDELLRWNRKTNLTAITDPRDIVSKHLLDCLAALPGALSGPLCDVGSGAGLPGLLWARERPGLRVVSVDARQRKAAFQTHMAARWRLPQFEARHARVEDLTERFPTVVCRAFAPLPRALPLLQPILQPDGQILALKGPGVEEELAGVDSRVWRYTMTPLQVPGLDARRWVVVLQPQAEVAATPHRISG